MPTKEDVMDALRNVIDPHLGINVVDMGFIYGVDVKGKNVKVRMTLTTPGCPMAQVLLRQVKDAVEKLGLTCGVELVFEPLWGVERMSASARKRLGV